MLQMHKSLLGLFIVIVCFDVLNAFPFFHFHRSDVKNITETIGANAASLQSKQTTIPDPSFTISEPSFSANAPAPATEGSAFLFPPTEPMKTDADANIYRLAKMIHNKQNINNNRDENLSVIFSPSGISSIISNNELPNMQQPQQPSFAESLLTSLKSVPQFQDAEVKVVGYVGDQNDIKNNNINNNINDNTEQTTQSEIWLELNKVLSGDIPESQTAAPISTQQQVPSPSPVNGDAAIPAAVAVFATNMDDISPFIKNILDKNSISRDSLLSQSNTGQETVQAINRIPSESTGITAAPRDLEEKVPQENSQTNVFEIPVLINTAEQLPQQAMPQLKQQQAEQLPQPQPVVRSHSYNNYINRLSDFYDSDKLNAPILEKPDDRPWYYKYIDAGEKAASWAQQKSNNLQSAYNEFKDGVMEIISPNNVQDSRDYYAHRSMEKQNQGIEHRYFNIF
ncbi:uncharacterized protein LOC142333792 isoform X2 [Lycorma delicatula]|uniref:uncharacterized protein LOC142333792 isoform X2 n=1 Tax=Lycorma delicatula TaxID=130591 RepID=UPI003F517C88